MPTINDDVIIQEHSLRLGDANGNEVAELDRDGNLVVRGAVLESLVEILQFAATSAELSVGAPGRLAVTGGSADVPGPGGPLDGPGSDGPIDFDLPDQIFLNGRPGTIRVLTNLDGGAIELRGQDATLDVGVGRAGTLVVRDSAALDVLRMDGTAAELSVGAPGRTLFIEGGPVDVPDTDGPGTGGPVDVPGTGGSVDIDIDIIPHEIFLPGRPGTIRVHDSSALEVVRIDGAAAELVVGAAGNPGDVVVRNDLGRDAFQMRGETGTLEVGVIGNAGTMIVRDGDGREALRLDGDRPATLLVGGVQNEGEINVCDVLGRHTVSVNGDDAAVYVGVNLKAGDLTVRDAKGHDAIHLDGTLATLTVGTDTNTGEVIIRDDTGTDRIKLSGSNGDISLMGADVAEEFQVSASVAPGAVVVAMGPDEVAPATAALDRRVVGVVSGAGDFRPALRLGTRPGDGRVPVAIMGRVYCQADAGHGAIAVGDTLTTSPTEGHAMRVADPGLAAGAVLGKALGPLERGTGLIPVLLTLR